MEKLYWKVNTEAKKSYGEKYFNINTGFMGIPYSIVFRPDGVSSYTPGETYKVTVTGLYKKNGPRAQISYEVTFFDMFASDLRGWVKEEGYWYYYDSTGYKAMGWLKHNDKWYYLNSDGVMRTGWVQVEGKWYLLDSNGVMVANTTISGFKIGKAGALIQ